MGDLLQSIGLARASRVSELILPQVVDSTRAGLCLIPQPGP